MLLLDDDGDEISYFFFYFYAMKMFPTNSFLIAYVFVLHLTNFLDCFADVILNLPNFEFVLIQH